MEKCNKINGLRNPHYSRRLRGLVTKLWLQGMAVEKIEKIVAKKVK